MQPPMTAFFLPLLALAVAAAPPPPADSRPPLSYADAADLALAAPVVAHVRVAEAIALKDAPASGVPAGLARLYVAADVIGLIRAPGALPARIAYLVDLPRDASGKAPRLKKGTELLVLAAPVPGRDGDLRLVARDGQLPYSLAE